MPVDDEPTGPGDWSFPPVEPAASPLGFSSDELPPTAAAPEPEPDPVPDLGWSEPPPASQLPPPNLNIPRRTPATSEPVSPLRAMAGALVAVAGVLLGIGALLWATDAPQGDPTLTATRQQATTQVASSPLVSPSPAAPPSVAPSVAPSRVPTVTQTSPVPATRPTVAAVPKLALTVLNNSNRPLLADRAARQFRAAGWPIKLTGNFRGRVTESTVYYEPGQLRSARLLQRSFPGLTRVRPRFETLPGSGLTVVLTRSYDA